MSYGNFRDLPRKTASDKASRNKAFTIAKVSMIDINVDLLRWFMNFLI